MTSPKTISMLSIKSTKQTKTPTENVRNQKYELIRLNLLQKSFENADSCMDASYPDIPRQKTNSAVILTETDEFFLVGDWLKANVILGDFAVENAVEIAWQNGQLWSACQISLCGFKDTIYPVKSQLHEEPGFWRSRGRNEWSR